ncbi:hypothetical protein [Microbacterium aquimaris]|uniref:Uncharacterized protein n=1 Tax=Microbacterium aquimaris TaxID=459816 RepID=A0ABU5N426_9MICO|nr:hypothetical protein [Microbacterium aquimaris]MDZ8160853.1 hypothetical protein [Microbacterium aquimaris]
MAESEWRPVHGVLMTSEPIEAYGGVAFPAALLRSFAENLDGGQFPFHLDHDLTKPIRTRHFEVLVQDRSDGIAELRFRAEMHVDDVHFIDSHPAMSATVMRPLARDEHSPHQADAPFQLSADHAWFGDEALIGAEEQLILRGVPAERLVVQRAYQFAVAPDPQIYIDVALTILLSVGANALWDGIKLLFARRRTPPGGDPTTPTTVNIEITDDTRVLRAVVATDDHDVAERAIDSLEVVAREFQRGGRSADGTSESAVPTTTWDDPNRRWTPPS